MIQGTNNFIEEIETIIHNKKTDYIDALLFWCEKNNLDVETAAYWVRKDPVMLSKLQIEAENLNILKKGARLPI